MMKITWTNQSTQYELAVRWRNAKENSLGSRIATLVDLKRASEVAGMLHDYVDRDEAFEREQKLKVRIAALEAEHDAYLDALAVDGCRPATVLAGIESLKTECANETAYAEKVDAELNEAWEATGLAGNVRGMTTLADVIGTIKTERGLANGVNRRAAQSIVECIGSVGPEDADSAAERIVSRLLELERANACARETINAVDKVLTLEARHPPSLDIVGRVRGLAEQANGLAKIIETRGNTITELEAALAEAKGHFALANEAYDELQARFDETSAERIALLEALEPQEPNAARAAAAMKREHEATRAVLGARDGEDLLSAAMRAVSLADLYRTHYRRTVIANSMTDRAMTEGLAECERLRARIAELEAKPEGWKSCLIASAVAGGVELMVKPAPSGFDVRVVMDNGEKLLASYADGIAGTKVPALIYTMLTEVGA